VNFLAFLNWPWSGTCYVTLSGSKNEKRDKDSGLKGAALPVAAEDVFKGQPYRVVRSGKVGRFEDADEEDDVTLKGSTAKNFSGQPLPQDYPGRPRSLSGPTRCWAPAPCPFCRMPVENKTTRLCS
jgi:hypothetical protein